MSHPVHYEKKNKKKIIFYVLFTLSLLVFLISGGMLLYESVIEPWINRGNIDDYQQLYPGAQSSSSAAPL